jgi:hypothetical protein
MKFGTGRVVSLFGGILFCALALHAQMNVGNIVGTVTDSSGAVVPAANVLAVNQGTGLSLKTTTGSSGLYALNSVPIGQYELTVTLPGFETYQRPDIPVISGETVTIDVSLRVGQMTQTVQVTATAPLLDTGASEGTSRTNQEIKALPSPFSASLLGRPLVW